MKKKVLIGLLVLGLSVGTASAQFGGVVYDPTNYHNALLRYFQLQQHLVQLQKTYAQVVSAYNLALEMSRNLVNMPARYRAQFSGWRNVTALNRYGNTGGWVTGANSSLGLNPTRCVGESGVRSPGCSVSSFTSSWKSRSYSASEISGSASL